MKPSTGPAGNNLLQRFNPDGLQAEPSCGHLTNWVQTLSCACHSIVEQDKPYRHVPSPPASVCLQTKCGRPVFVTNTQRKKYNRI